MSPRTPPGGRSRALHCISLNNNNDNNNNNIIIIIFIIIIIIIIHLYNNSAAGRRAWGGASSRLPACAACWPFALGVGASGRERYMLFFPMP